MAEQTLNGGVSGPHPSPKTSLGDLLKRFSPAHRFRRSKSPTSTVLHNSSSSGTTPSTDDDKKSSWVTVEFKTDDETPCRPANGFVKRRPPRMQKSSTLPSHILSSDSSGGTLSAFFARASFRRRKAEVKQPPPAPVQQKTTSATKAISRIVAASEENLMSKSLTARPPDDEEPPKKSLPCFYSQNNVFEQDVRGIGVGRVPSYVRLSCTLSGYTNYRSVDLRTSSKKHVPKLSVCSQTIEIGPSSDYPLKPPVASSTPKGKSIVERRLETFNNKTPADSRPSNGGSVDVELTFVPVKDIIDSFNRRTPPAVPPRLKQDLGDVSKIPADVEQLYVNGTCRKIDTKLARQNSHPANSLLPAVAANSTTTEQVNGSDESSSSPQQNNDDSSRLKHNETTGSSAFVRLSHDANSHDTTTKMNGHAAGTSHRDGRYYETLAGRERQRLRTVAEAAEADLRTDELPEHAAEEIRVVVGKFNLLLKKKFAMFETLIAKNLNPIPDDPCPAYDSDLEGFWQLVSMELADIEEGFSRIEQMRKSNWSKIEVDSSDIKNSKVKSGAKKPTTVRTTATSDKTSDRDQTRRNNLQQAKLAALERQKGTNAASVGFFEI